MQKSNLSNPQKIITKNAIGWTQKNQRYSGEGIWLQVFKVIDSGIESIKFTPRSFANP